MICSVHPPHNCTVKIRCRKSLWIDEEYQVHYWIIICNRGGASKDVSLVTPAAQQQNASLRNDTINCFPFISCGLYVCVRSSKGRMVKLGKSYSYLFKGTPRGQVRFSIFSLSYWFTYRSESTAFKTSCMLVLTYLCYLPAMIKRLQALLLFIYVLLGHFRSFRVREWRLTSIMGTPN